MNAAPKPAVAIPGSPGPSCSTFHPWHVARMCRRAPEQCLQARHIGIQLRGETPQFGARRPLWCVPCQAKNTDRRQAQRGPWEREPYCQGRGESMASRAGVRGALDEHTEYSRDMWWGRYRTGAMTPLERQAMAWINEPKDQEVRAGETECQLSNRDSLEGETPVSPDSENI